ncbi:MAG: hypothetical protein J1E40_02120 [Oscillospiraceae bacterium]|nr:hypothetical protein [Oscillospiraceae bacterium]
MKSSRLKMARKEEQQRVRDISPRQWKAIAITCGVVLGIALILFSADLFRAKRSNLPPLFCVPVIEYDNGSVDYYGLFYKVWKDYDPFDDETRYYMGFWFIPKNINI